MQRVLVALMLGAAAAFQRTPVVRSRVLAVFIQLHYPGRSSSRGDAASDQFLPRELKQLAGAAGSTARTPRLVDNQ